MAQPHWEQSGFTPKMHGSTRVARSNELFVDILANMHSCGLAGGTRIAREIPSLASNLGYRNRNPGSSAATLWRSAGLNISVPFVLLRRVQTKPDANYLGTSVPKRNIFFNVVGALKHGPGDRAMHVHLTPGYVLQDAIVRGWLASHVMMFRKAVHGDCHPHAWNIHPVQRNRDNSACDHHGVDVHAAQDRQYATQFAMASQWLATYERDMQGATDAEPVARYRLPIGCLGSHSSFAN
jgi:hypothetical protein